MVIKSIRFNSNISFGAWKTKYKDSIAVLSVSEPVEEYGYDVTPIAMSPRIEVTYMDFSKE
jgi:hypothetical protein